MLSIGSMVIAPERNLYRFLTAADDAGSRALKGNGVNCGHYLSVHFLVVPLAFPPGTKRPTTIDELLALGLSAASTTNPDVTLRAWNPVLSRFENFSPSVSVLGIGAGESYEFSVNAEGRIIMVELTGAPAANEAVAVLVSGYEIDHTL